MASARFIETLLYQVKATDLGALALPPLAILITALVAATPTVDRAPGCDSAIGVERDVPSGLRDGRVGLKPSRRAEAPPHDGFGTTI